MEVSREEYFYLQNRDDMLTCLEIAGVDNWDGYQYAREEYLKTHKEDDSGD